MCYSNKNQFTTQSYYNFILINKVYNELSKIDELKRTKTCKSTINYCEHILKLLKEAKTNDELSFINIIN